MSISFRFSSSFKVGVVIIHVLSFWIHPVQLRYLNVFNFFFFNLASEVFIAERYCYLSHRSSF